MPFISLGRGWGDEYEVSDFAAAAHDGDLQKVKNLMQSKSDWKEDTMALYLALRKGEREIYKYLVESGIRINQDTYLAAIREDESYLKLLPENPQALKEAIAIRATSELNHGLLVGELSATEVRDLIKKGAKTNEAYFFNYAVQDQLPIQIATRHPNLEVVKVLVEAGADLSVTKKVNKSIARLVLESDELTREEIMNFYKYFKSKYAPFIPELTFWEKVRLWRGKSLYAIMLMISIFSSQSSLAEDLPAQWTTKCTFGKVQVSLMAKSKSGDAYEDDMDLQLQIGQKKLPVNLGTYLFEPLMPPKALSACDKIVGISMNENQSLLLFIIDDRPLLDNLAALLIDTRLGLILDTKRNLGAFFHSSHENDIKIEKTKLGFRAYMAQGWSKTSKTDSVKEIFMGWVNVVVKDGRIIASWEKPLLSTHGPYSAAEVSPAPLKK